VPSGRGFIALLEAFRGAGGTAPGEIVARLLEEHQAGNAVSLAKLVYTGQIFGFEWRYKLWIPMFQFDADTLALMPGAQRVRSSLPPLWSEWLLAFWFAAPNDQLDGRRPVDLLESDLDAVLLAAGQVHWSPVSPGRARGLPFASELHATPYGVEQTSLF
jgi:Protein of unknown function (DUF2384)